MRPFLHHQDISAFSFLLISYTKLQNTSLLSEHSVLLQCPITSLTAQTGKKKKENSQAAIRWGIIPKLQGGWRRCCSEDRHRRQKWATASLPALSPCAYCSPITRNQGYTWHLGRRDNCPQVLVLTLMPCSDPWGQDLSQVFNLCLDCPIICHQIFFSDQVVKMNKLILQPLFMKE